MTELDLRENLFLEFKKIHIKHENLRNQIRLQQSTLESLHSDMIEIEKEYMFLRKVINLVLVEDIDPILAKFRISEELKNPEIHEKITAYNVYTVEPTLEVHKKNKIKRTINAIKEIWNER